MKQSRHWTMAVAVLAIAGAVFAQDANKSWTDKLTIKGDVRYRYQSSDEEGKDHQPREQHRLRARLNIGATVADDLKVGIRLVTNNGNPISDNITLTDSFDDKEFRIDQAFFDWQPTEGLNVLAGKMAQPWISVSDLVFSTDMNPEGVAIKGSLELAEGATGLMSVGYWQLQERSEDADTTMGSDQIALRLAPREGVHVVVGTGIFAFKEIKGRKLLHNETKSFGNTTRKVGSGDTQYLVYANDYSVVEGFVETGFPIAGIPVVLSGQYAINTDADADDKAYLGQIKIGQASAPKTWELGYQYRRLEKDSVLGVFAENTDTGNGTDVSAHIPYVAYAVHKNFTIKLQYAMAQKGLDNGKDLDTFKADFLVKF